MECSKSNESFTSLTVHWLDEDFSHKSTMRHFPGRHTGALIESNFNLMLSEWSIDHSHIQMLVHDGASNIALTHDCLSWIVFTVSYIDYSYEWNVQSSVKGQ